MTVDDLFRDLFGNYTHDRLGKINGGPEPMPLESVCGAECEQVMKDGKVLFDHASAASGESSHRVAKVVHQICSIFVNG